MAFPLALLSFLLLSSARAGPVAPRATVIPPPYSFAPDQNWEGIDGQWNTYTVRVGSPSQYMRVLPATSSQQTWVVNTGFCQNESYYSSAFDCSQARGGLFNVTASTTWKEIGWYDLWIESNLGFSGNANYGYDTVALGFVDGSGADNTTLLNTTVGVLESPDFWFGHFGLHPKPTNFSIYNEGAPSYMTYLKEQGHIPSLSYGYTAGAPYRFTKILSSLTLGGYDSSRFIPNNISYPFAPDNEHELTFYLQAITMTDSTVQDAALLDSTVIISIDSVVSEIWLPVEVCERFEKAFGLVYDEDYDLYLVNSSLHTTLLAQNANVTFTVAPQANGGPSTDIVLPYAAFDLIAIPPYQRLANETNYFPLRRGQNATQWVLGRTFLQEAYLIVDHERSTFSISQVRWVANAEATLVAIQPVPTNSSKSAGMFSDADGLKKGAIIGIAVAIGVTVIGGAVVGYLLWKRRRDRTRAKQAAKLAADVAAVKDNRSEKSQEGTLQSPQNVSSPTANPDGTQVYPKAELPAEDPPRHEMADTSECAGVDTLSKSSDSTAPESPTAGVGTNDTGVPTLFEADGNERHIFEMEGSIPGPSEADGRMLSEKETMIVRERRYNGMDPEPMPSPSSPTDSHPDAGPSPARSRRSLVAPGDVAMVPRAAATRLTLVPPSLLLRPVSDRRADGGGLGSLPVSPLTPRPGITLEETILSPLSPLPPDSSDGGRTLNTPSSLNPDRRRFSYELDD